MIYLALLIGSFCLFKGGGWLLDGMVGIGQKLHMSKAMIGLILVSLGTSAPELFVSLGAALQGYGGMAAGNVIGSNIINISIVLGLTVSIVGITVGTVMQHQIIALIVISLCAMWATLDGVVSRVEGLFLIVVMIASFVIAVKYDRYKRDDIDQAPDSIEQSIKRSIILTAGGIIALMIGAESLIWGGLSLAEKLGLSETIIALTVTAIGTSLPEIAATVVAIIRRDTSLALGNVIGSNLLNIGLVMGISAAIFPLQNLDLDGLTLAFFIGLVAAIYLFSIRPGYIPRWSGFALLSSYVAYITLLITT